MRWFIAMAGLLAHPFNFRRRDEILKQKRLEPARWSRATGTAHRLHQCHTRAASLELFIAFSDRVEQILALFLELLGDIFDLGLGCLQTMPHLLQLSCLRLNLP
jgi:hypothetical protein